MSELLFLDSIVKMPVMSLPVRSVVAKVKSSTILISPGSQLTEEQLKSQEPVTDIVGTSLFHCAGVKKAAKIYPHAKIWGPKGVKTIKPNIAWTHELSEASWPYHDELTAIEINGMPKVKETVFVHRGSKSLIVSDLCFNIIDAKGFGAWLILSMFGTYRKFGVSKFFAKYVIDKADFQNSMQKVFSFDFENIVTSHGAIVRGNAKTILKNALLERGLANN